MPGVGMSGLEGWEVCSREGGSPEDLSCKRHLPLPEGTCSLLLKGPHGPTVHMDSLVCIPKIKCVFPAFSGKPGECH